MSFDSYNQARTGKEKTRSELARVAIADARERKQLRQERDDLVLLLRALHQDGTSGSDVQGRPETVFLHRGSDTISFKIRWRQDGVPVIGPKTREKLAGWFR